MAWIIGAIIVIGIFWFSLRAGLAATVFLAVVYISLWFFSGQQSSQSPSNNSVTVSVSSNSASCQAPGEPIGVTFTNKAEKPLMEISFSLLARETGHSSVIYRAYLRSDKILAPAESYTGCYGLNTLSFTNRTESYDPRSLEWAAEISLTKFENE